MPKKRARVFFDASVLVAAAHSPTGGSALVLEVCGGKTYEAAASRRVLLEAYSNIRKKFGSEEVLRFYRGLAALEPEIVEKVSREEERRYEPVIGPRDAHVLAGAAKSRCEYLLTLDKKHFLTNKVLSADLAFQVLTPGQFLAQVVRAPGKAL